MTGRVIKSTGSWYLVALHGGDNNVISCRVPGKFRLEGFDQTNPLTVGDIVDIDEIEDGTGIIRAIHDRKNMITRQATHGKRGQQIMAANIDLGIVVQSVKKPAYKTGFIDRFLITCEANHVVPLILMNKIDLANEKDISEITQLQSMYSDLGYEMMTVSTREESTIRDFYQRIQGLTVTLMGPSGTGKTSILNALNPSLSLATGEISDFSNKGKHTTTFAELLEVKPGTFIVDTPGIREFGLVDIDPEDLSNFYVEMKDLRMQCRYYNCTHIHEPECAVTLAFERGEIDQSRYMSYLQIFESLNT